MAEFQMTRLQLLSLLIHLKCSFFIEIEHHAPFFAEVHTPWNKSHKCTTGALTTNSRHPLSKHFRLMYSSFFSILNAWAWFLKDSPTRPLRVLFHNRDLKMLYIFFADFEVSAERKMFGIPWSKLVHVDWTKSNFDGYPNMKDSSTSVFFFAWNCPHWYNNHLFLKDSGHFW